MHPVQRVSRAAGCGFWATQTEGDYGWLGNLALPHDTKSLVKSSHTVLYGDAGVQHTNTCGHALLPWRTLWHAVAVAARHRGVMLWLSHQSRALRSQRTRTE